MNINVDFYDPVFLEKLRNVHIVAKKLFHGRLRGKRRSMKKGSSIEFAEFRSYSPGDDFRFIDWNIMARLKKVMIRSFWDEENISVNILVDTSKSMHFGSNPRIIFAKKVSACLASVALANHDSVGLGTFSDKPVSMILAHTGTNQLNQCFTLLQNIQPEGDTNIDLAIRRTLNTGYEKGILIIISDMLDTHGFQPPLIYALAHGFEVHLIHIGAHPEITHYSPALRLRDSETGGYMDINCPDTLNQLLIDEQNRYSEEIEKFCHSRKIPYFYADTETQFDVFVLQYFKTLFRTN
ncbi:MAG: DUF58 domain-containing protein [Candidatus Auribacterota bacterium]|nr:DUF58 domain-containing protein [Candidatus Auribacterota bacterium]